MKNQPSINDWAEYLIWAEKNLKDLEDMLLHQRYDIEEIAKHVTAINHALAKTVDWVIDEHFQRKLKADAKQK